MRRLLNPLRHTAARPALRTPLFQAQQVRGFAKRVAKKGTKKAAAAPKAAASSSAPPSVDKIAAIAAATDGIPTLPATHTASMIGYVGVAARALWNGAAADGAQSLANVEQEVEKLYHFLNKPSSSEVEEFAQSINEQAGASFPDYVVTKELTGLRRQALDRHIRRAIREKEAGAEDAEPADERFQFSPLMDTALIEITQAKRFKKLDNVFREFQNLMDAYKGITRAIVTVAQPLSADQETLVRKFLKVECGENSDIILSVQEDASLIAGMQIQVGEKSWNMAASHHLQKSKKTLHASMSGRQWQYDKGRMFA